MATESNAQTVVTPTADKLCDKVDEKKACSDEKVDHPDEKAENGVDAKPGDIVITTSPEPEKPKRIVYAVRRGVTAGIFYDINECLQSVVGVPFSEFQLFHKLTDASRYLYEYCNVYGNQCRPPVADNVVVAQVVSQKGMCSARCYNNSLSAYMKNDDPRFMHIECIQKLVEELPDDGVVREILFGAVDTTADPEQPDYKDHDYVVEALVKISNRMHEEHVSDPAEVTDPLMKEYKQLGLFEGLRGLVMKNRARKTPVTIGTSRRFDNLYCVVAARYKAFMSLEVLLQSTSQSTQSKEVKENTTALSEEKKSD